MKCESENNVSTTPQNCARTSRLPTDMDVGVVGVGLGDLGVGVMVQENSRIGCDNVSGREGGSGGKWENV